VCTTCGELLAAIHFKEIIRAPPIDLDPKSTKESLVKEKEALFINQDTFCSNCQKSSCVRVAIPYVLRYLTNELAAMNIKLSFVIKK
jgi:DNA-directed RNA polymerase I subunit RPA2